MTELTRAKDFYERHTAYSESIDFWTRVVFDARNALDVARHRERLAYIAHGSIYHDPFYSTHHEHLNEANFALLHATSVLGGQKRNQEDNLKRYNQNIADGQSDYYANQEAYVEEALGDAEASGLDVHLRVSEQL